MNAATRRERDRRVAEAARVWHEGGILTPDELQAILDRYPGGGPVDSIYRDIAFFLFATACGIFLLTGLAVVFMLAVNRFEPVIPLLLTGAALCLQGDRMNRDPDEANEGEKVAFQFWGTVALVLGLTFLGEGVGVLQGYLSGLVIFGVAAWSWGRGLFVFLATASLLGAVHVVFHHPAAWALTAAVLTAGSTCLLSERLGRGASRRECGQSLLWVALPAIYLAVNRYAVDGRWLFDPSLSTHSPPTTAGLAQSPDSLYACFASWATAIYPLALIVWGLRSRILTVLNFGLAFLMLSLATLYAYVPLVPLWMVLCFGGLAMARLAWALHGWLDRQPGQEWRGFTTRSLCEDSLRREGLGRVSKFLGKKLTGG